MRRNFAQTLKAGKIEIKKEYSNMYELFYGKQKDGKSMHDCISNNFLNFFLRGTCLTLDDFDEKHGFIFEKQPQDFNLDYLITFCEYVYNLINYVDDNYFMGYQGKMLYYNQIRLVIEAIGYVEAKEDNFVIFVPKDNVAMEVSKSELIPEGISYKIIAYHHHSMKGNLNSKKDIILKLADLLEPKRAQLKNMVKEFESDLFFLFNICNIRHNNIEPNSKSYKKVIADLSEIELEKWYDEIYQMCLLAFMQLEQKERKSRIDELKKLS